MSLSASDFGSTSGALALQYAQDGKEPHTQAGVLVLKKQTSWNRNPFTTFVPPSHEDWMAAFGGRGSFVSSSLAEDSEPRPLAATATSDAALNLAAVISTLHQVNTIIEKWEEIGGPNGCTNDRICGCPPWVCCLPPIFCLGGICLLARQGKHNVRRCTQEINQFLSAAPRKTSWGTWTLCAARHESKVDMAAIRLQQLGDGNARGSSPTVTEFLSWIEIRV